MEGVEAPDDYYTQVNVFIVTWKNEDTNHRRDVAPLQEVFVDQYGWRVRDFQIEEDYDSDSEEEGEMFDSPEEQLQHEMGDEEGDEGRDVLWIFIYMGHGGLEGESLNWVP